MSDAPVPRVGMGCTVSYGSDCCPYTIVQVYRDGNRKVTAFDMKEDIAIRTDDRGAFTERQEYEYRFNPEAPAIEVTWRRDGKWKIRGDTKVVHVGSRRYYRDPSL